MSLIKVSVKHGLTMEVAQRRLETAVSDLSRRFGLLIQQTKWSDDRRAVALIGRGFNVRLHIEGDLVHVEGDIPALGRLFGSGIGSVIHSAIEDAFRDPKRIK